MAKRKPYVLIKWLEGENSNTYKVVRSKRVIEFNLEEFFNGSPNEKNIYMVRWRHDERFPIFQAEVLEVNRSKSVLKERRDTLQEKYEKELSVSLKRSLSFGEQEAPERKQIKLNDEHYNKNILLDKIKVVIDEFPCAKCQALENRVVELQNNVIALQTKLYEEKMECQSLQNEKEVQQIKMKNIVAVDPKEFSELQEKISRLSEVLPVNEISILQAHSTPISNNESSYKPGPKRVEIYEGSGVYVLNSIWIQLDSYEISLTKFVNGLLMALFPIGTLLRSSVSGGCRWNSKEKVPRDQLNPEKLTALTNAVMKKFPGTDRKEIMQKITSKISNLRIAEKSKSTNVGGGEYTKDN